MAARLATGSHGTELLLDACASLKLHQEEMRRGEGLYPNTELSSTYPARASPTCQCDMLLSTAGTTYGCWRHLMGCGLCGPAGSLGCLPGF
ncbi:Acetylserotonin O-Methyltransferase [Manis pentadactyla]|nr:Acetylserotonin O-Methyltransferase [Manis pentadactyla]